jgi:1,4-alpha-glucan branching enzyme
MGSTLYGGGATFRVWAPNADSVAVAGSFNGWSKQADPLAAEGNGYWSVDVDGARAGDGYKYVITYQSAVLNPWRPDPYGQAMATSVGDTLIHAPDFDWGAGSFQMPGWDELVIYELHVGTYSDEQGGGPGRLASVMARLDHLVELGVNAIQLLPRPSSPAASPGATTRRRSSPSRPTTAAPTPSSNSSGPPTNAAWPWSATSSTTTSAPATLPCGGSTAGI